LENSTGTPSASPVASPKTIPFNLSKDSIRQFYKKEKKSLPWRQNHTIITFAGDGK
jgi:adenine-specific DNA glycosylase